MEILTRPQWAAQQGQTQDYNPIYDVVGYRAYAQHARRIPTPAAQAPAVAPTPAAAPEPKKLTLPGEARSAWETAIAQYAPGGGYGRGVEAGLERGRTKALASGMQSLVSAGLAGTTEAAGLGKKYEEEVAAPARGRVEETRAQAIAQLQAGLATAEQRGYETAEDRALRERLGMGQLSTQQAIASLQAGTQQTIAGGQLGLGYAQLAGQQTMAGRQLQSQERMSSRDLAMEEILAKMRTQQPTGGTTGGYGASFGEAGGGYWD